jgi:hypothetical protein
MNILETMKNKIGLEPQDLSGAAKTVVDVYQGRVDKLPQLMKEGSQVLQKMSSKLSRTQMIITVGVLAAGLVFAVTKLKNTNMA